MSELNLNSLYQQLILEHYRKPRNKGELPEKTVEVHMANPVCGDEIRLQLQVEDDTIVEVRHMGQGCSISQAAVSMMTQLMKGKDLGEAEGLGRPIYRDDARRRRCRQRPNDGRSPRPPGSQQIPSTNQVRSSGLRRTSGGGQANQGSLGNVTSSRPVTAVAHSRPATVASTAAALPSWLRFAGGLTPLSGRRGTGPVEKCGSPSDRWESDS